MRKERINDSRERETTSELRRRRRRRRRRRIQRQWPSSLSVVVPAVWCVWCDLSEGGPSKKHKPTKSLPRNHDMLTSPRDCRIAKKWQLRHMKTPTAGCWADAQQTVFVKDAGTTQRARPSVIATTTRPPSHSSRSFRPRRRRQAWTRPLTTDLPRRITSTTSTTRTVYCSSRRLSDCLALVLRRAVVPSSTRPPTLPLHSLPLTRTFTGHRLGRLALLRIRPLGLGCRPTMRGRRCPRPRTSR